MSKRNFALTILAVIALGWVLFKGLATAWVGMKLLPFVGILFFFILIAFFWGRFSR
jgi:uncharacterized membrane protein